MVGKFYAAPSPSDPPFVDKGTKVAAGATVGLIEVMKVFASIKTETAGVIERILVSNGQFVEFGQTLFLLRPDRPRLKPPGVAMDEIRFVDTTIRDGHQSLWAERMSTGMMLPIAKRLDEAGFLAIELLSGSHIKKAVRELREDPWERIRRVAERVPNTPLRLIAGRVNTFGFDPPCMYELFIERMAANGIRQARISEPWNDLPGWSYRVDVARKFGLDPIVNLIYSVSPVHTDEYYAERCRQAVTLKPFRLCLKDPAAC